jgi:hypothetical protein
MIVYPRCDSIEGTFWIDFATYYLDAHFSAGRVSSTLNV